MAVRVILKDWLAKENKISRELTGTVKAETEKAILFEGRAFAEERTHCIRCGRELTHPSSKFVGFGPICCGKLGIEWPDRDLLTQEDINSLKAKINSLEWSGWLPKSQVEIIGEYELPKVKVSVATKIGVVAKEKPDGTLEVQKVAVRSKYSDKELCQIMKAEFGGKWNPDQKQWEYPLSTKVVDKAKELWESEIEISDLLLDWYEGEKSKTQNLLNEKDKADAELRTSLNSTLRDYQRVGVSFLTKAERAILGDDMGTGKTLQAIATCDEVGAEKVLIICPNSLKRNWAKEIKKWLPSETIQMVDGDKKKRLKQLAADAKFKIINYEATRLHAEELTTDWDVIILDEAHKVKNRKAQQTKAVQKIAKGAKRVYHLTGTPLMNKPDEIWSLLNILDSKRFSSFWRFVEQYCEVWDNGWGKEIGGAKDPEAFRQMLAPLMLRRVKADVLKDLPEKTTQKQYVDLVGEQKKIYKQMEQNMVTEIAGKEVAAPVVIAQITRLKQICVSPALLGADDNSAKLDAMMEIIENSGDQKVVVFSQFAEGIKLAAKRLKSAGIGYGLLIGEMSTEERERDVERFQTDPNCKVFLATIQAGGVGITLTAASVAIFLDKHWTPAINNQAADRLHRIGQMNPVTIYELIAQDTVEEWIEGLLKDKSDTFDSLINGKVTGLRDLLSTINFKAKAQN